MATEVSAKATDPARAVPAEAMEAAASNAAMVEAAPARATLAPVSANRNTATAAGAKELNCITAAGPVPRRSLNIRSSS